MNPPLLFPTPHRPRQHFRPAALAHLVSLSILCGILGAGGVDSVSGADAAIIPLTRAHAHNDYEHTRPLLDALDQGFCSVEADVWLIDGELRVAHDERD